MKYAMLFILTGLMMVLSGCDEEDSIVEPVILESEEYLVIAGKYSLNLFDLEKNYLIETELGLGNSPNWIIPDGNRLYVVSSLSNNLQIFEFDGNEVTFIENIDLGLESNCNPYAAALSGDGRLLITNLMNNTVSVLNLETCEIMDTWETGIAPEGIIVHESRVYVVNSGFNYDDLTYHNGSLWCYNLATGAILGTVELGNNPQFVDVDTYGRLHVTCTGDYDDISGSVWIINTSPLFVLEQIPVDAFPGRISIAPSGKAYIAAGGWTSDGDESGLVLSYNANDLSQMSLIPVGFGALDVLSCSRDSRIIVACQNSQSIEFIEDNEVVTTYVLSDYPQALAVWKLDLDE